MLMILLSSMWDMQDMQIQIQLVDGLMRKVRQETGTRYVLTAMHNEYGTGDWKKKATGMVCHPVYPAINYGYMINIIPIAYIHPHILYQSLRVLIVMHNLPDWTIRTGMPVPVTTGLILRRIIPTNLQLPVWC